MNCALPMPAESDHRVHNPNNFTKSPVSNPIQNSKSHHTKPLPKTQKSSDRPGFVLNSRLLNLIRSIDKLHEPVQIQCDIFSQEYFYQLQLNQLYGVPALQEDCNTVLLEVNQNLRLRFCSRAESIHPDPSQLKARQ